MSAEDKEPFPPSQKSNTGNKLTDISNDLAEKLKQEWGKSKNKKIMIIIIAILVPAIVISVLTYESEPEEAFAMIDLEGATVSDAKDDVGDMEANIDLVEVDVTNEDRSIFMSSNWKICKQSVPAGDDVYDGDEVSVYYTRTGEECAENIEIAEGGEAISAFEMADLEGETVEHARSELSNSGVEIDLIEIDETDEDRSIFMASNWKVCKQSIPAGESFNGEGELSIHYTRTEEDCKSDFEGAQMPSLAGMNVENAENKLKDLSTSITLEREDFTDKDRGVDANGEWIVCEQSIPEGEDLVWDENIILTYAVEEEGCITIEDWVSSVTANWQSVRDDITIEEVTAEEIGRLQLNISESSSPEPVIAQWAESGLTTMINTQLPDDVADVSSVDVYMDGEQLSAKETVNGLHEVEARTACDFRLDAEFPYGSKAHWVLDNNGSQMIDNATAWQIGAGVTLEDQWGGEFKREVVCIVGGESMDTELLHFEVR